MSSSSSSSSGGIGFVGLLTIVFVIAKLTGHLDWTWWWVFSPVWIGWGFILAILAVIALIAVVTDTRPRWRRR